MTTQIRLNRVQYIPKQLELGILYVAEEFGAAAHLCPCGCGSKVRTPLDATEWSLEETPQGPSLYPSIGNWQQPCQSHYWIHKGTIEWSNKWTTKQIVAGRRREEEKRITYYHMLDKKRKPLTKLWYWIKGLFE